MPAPDRRRFRRLKPSITTALVLSFGALILFGMALVLGISIWTGQKNTRELLADNAELAMLSLVRETRRRIAPVEQANAYVADLVVRNRIDLKDRKQVVQVLLTSMAGTPQVFGMALIEPDGTVIRVRRGTGELPQARSPLTGNAENALTEARVRKTSYWGNPIWLPELKSTMFAVRTPIWEDGTFRGVLVSGVTVTELSRFIARSSDAPLTGNRFILFGRYHVLAHRNMADGGFNRNDDIPLPGLDEVGDPVLAKLWSTNDRRRMLIDLAPSTEGHATEIDGRTHLFLYRELDDFGVPLIVGIYAGPDNGLGIEFRRLVWAGAACFGVILLSLVGAILIGRGMSKPIKALAEGSAAVAELDLERVGRLPPSRLREIDDAADAFNRMTTGLRWFETYVPHQIVRRLIQRDAPVASEEKIVTVMFTDIAGFSSLSEHMPAAETAALLNAHFTLIAACIEAEHGTVDKYIGDSVMAFWEPDEAGGASVDRAVRAAAEIRRRLHTDNELRAHRGDIPVTIRIGIHTGMAIVGNIGAPGRVNYTLVGDTVNLAARIQELCKEIAPEEDAVILLSDETVRRSENSREFTPRGAFRIRGRDAEVEVYSLDL